MGHLPISAIGTNLRNSFIVASLYGHARSNEDVLDVYSSTHELIINFCFASIYR